MAPWALKLKIKPQSLLSVAPKPKINKKYLGSDDSLITWFYYYLNKKTYNFAKK